MSAVDRCACPSAYGICDGPQPDCSEHGTADEILASGRYVDRRGRPWEKRIRWSTSSGRRMWSHLYRLEPLLGGPVYRIIDEAQMRLLIERDLHRDVCPGLINCDNHPAPSVLLTKGGELEFLVFGPRQVRSIRAFDYHSEAMDAARALAVEP